MPSAETVASDRVNNLQDGVTSLRRTTGHGDGGDGGDNGGNPGTTIDSYGQHDHNISTTNDEERRRLWYIRTRQDEPNGPLCTRCYPAAGQDEQGMSILMDTRVKDADGLSQTCTSGFCVGRRASEGQEQWEAGTIEVCCNVDRVASRRGLR